MVKLVLALRNEKLDDPVAVAVEDGFSFDTDVADVEDFTIDEGHPRWRPAMDTARSGDVFDLR